MSINNDTMIKVYNYEEAPVCIPSKMQSEGILISAGRINETNEEIEPTIETVSYIDIELENSKSDTFKIGRLRFEDSMAEEIYDKLRIQDRENILTEKKIRQIMLDSSVENLKRIDKINSVELITRFKDLMMRMQLGTDTIPNSVLSVITDRYNFLVHKLKNDNSHMKKVYKEIEEKEKDGAYKKAYEEMKQEVDALKKDNEKAKETESSFGDLMKMFQELKEENKELKKNSDNQIKVEEETDEKKSKATKKDKK